MKIDHPMQISQQRRVLRVVLLAVLLLGSTLALRPQPGPAADQAPAVTPTNQRDAPAAALYRIQAAASASGWTAEHHRRAGDLWRDMGDVARALPHWEAASPGDPELLRRIAGIYIEQNRWADALDTLQALLTLVPGDPWGHLQAGLILAPTDPGGASEHLQPLLLHPSYSDLARSLYTSIQSQDAGPLLSSQIGAILAEDRRYAHAEYAFRYAAAIGAPFPEALAYAGLMRALQNKDGQALIDEALHYAPDNADVRIAQGVYQRLTGAYELSAATLLEAIKLEPGNPVIYAELGTTYQRLSQLTEAEYWLRAALNVSGSDPEIEAALREFYAEEAALLPEQVLQHFSQSAASSEDPDALAAHGWALHATGESEAGLAKIEQALELAPGHPRALYDQARILIDMGEIGAARPLLTQLAEGESTYAEPAQRLLEGLR